MDMLQRIKKNTEGENVSPECMKTLMKIANVLDGTIIVDYDEEDKEYSLIFHYGDQRISGSDRTRMVFYIDLDGIITRIFFMDSKQKSILGKIEN